MLSGLPRLPGQGLRIVPCTVGAALRRLSRLPRAQGGQVRNRCHVIGCLKPVFANARSGRGPIGHRQVSVHAIAFLNLPALGVRLFNRHPAGGCALACIPELFEELISAAAVGVSLLLEMDLLDVRQRREQFAQFLLQLGKSGLIGLVLIIVQQIVLLEIILIGEFQDLLEQANEFFEVQTAAAVVIELRDDSLNICPVSSQTETDQQFLDLSRFKDSITGFVELFEEFLQLIK